MSAVKDREHWEALLDDLATDQLGPPAALRLRRRIARDPELAKAWQAVRLLKAGLCQTTRSPLPVRSKRRRPAFALTGVALTHRAAVLATFALFTLSVTGALAERYWPKPEAVADETTAGRTIDHWAFRGRFRGRIEMYDSHGVMERETWLEGDLPDGAVQVTCSSRGRDLAMARMVGVGRHEIRDSSGKLCGSVVLSQFSAEEEQGIADNTEAALRDYLDYYRRPACVEPVDAKRGFDLVNSLPGLTGGIFYREFSPGRKDVAASIPGSSWKVYGAVRVKATYEDARRTDYLPGDKSVHITVPAQRIVQNISSRQDLSIDGLGELTTAQKKTLADTCVVLPVPKAYWVIADRTADTDPKTGEWRKVLRSGTFTGYGHHVVADADGKAIMVLDISPLTSVKVAR